MLGVALLLVFLTLAETDANPDDASSVVAAALIDNRDAARLGAYLGIVAAFLLIVFVARLHGALRNVANPGSWFPGLALVGGAVLVGVILVEVGFTFAATELQSLGEDAPAAKLFVLWSWNSANLAAPGFAALLAGSTLVSFTANAFPPWFRWAGAGLLLLTVIVWAAGTPGLALAPGIVWVGLASVLLTVSAATVPQPRQPDG
jgi:hypothetical protein